MKRVFISAIAASVIASPAYAVDTTSSTDANALATSLLGDGVTLVSATLSSNTENGFFTGGAAATGIADGVVLTTGALTCIGSANTLPNCSGGGSSSQLDIVFTTDDDTLFFNYVFGSEEYNTFAGSEFNDTFSLTLNGLGFDNVNLALLPNGDVVSINTVNPDVNSEYYRNNNDEATVLGTTAPNLNLPIELDGLTVLLTASASGLTAGSEYTLSFLIADVGDSNLDSAVFIQGGTISTEPPVVPEPASWAMMIGGFGLVGGAMRRSRTKLAFA